MIRWFAIALTWRLGDRRIQSGPVRGVGVCHLVQQDPHFFAVPLADLCQLLSAPFLHREPLSVDRPRQAQATGLERQLAEQRDNG